MGVRCRFFCTFKAYLDEVITPSLSALGSRINELGVSIAPGHEFAKNDMVVVLSEAKMAFALSVQSIWERQLRCYLRGCARELHLEDAVDASVEKADWEKLCKLFHKLRGIKLQDFPSYETLDTLQQLGNACRHGDGRSASVLWRRCPDLWPPVSPPLPLEFEPLPPALPSLAPPPVSAMDISIEYLRGFVHAIAVFWRDTEYIYNESIVFKHPSLEARLVKERAQRQWRPQATAIGTNDDGII